jgi:regulation of enolase protein 1 (concanavalin A-like superfamily)
MVTQRGTIENDALDLPASGIRLGPVVGDYDDVSVRLTFIPEHAYQQAGLMIFQDPDQYIKFGRQFSGRVYWEFGKEDGGRYFRTPETWTYDPLGQTGQPAWLLIRRRQNVFRAFVSVDGRDWHQVGSTLEVKKAMPNARVGIYAYNGQVTAARIPAHFDQLGMGLAFSAGWQNDSERWPPDGWRVESGCPESADAGPAAHALEFRFATQSCIWQFVRSVPKGDWVFTTNLDFLPFGGAVAGLILKGSKGRLRLVRWSLNGGSVAIEHPPGNQVISRPDFPGSPPLTLRLEYKGGKLQGGFSRDEVSFTSLSVTMPLSELGDALEVGVTTQSTSWNKADALLVTQFQYLRQEIVQPLANYR